MNRDEAFALMVETIKINGNCIVVTDGEDYPILSATGIALMMKSYYDGFIKAGFDSMQAMYLTSNMGSTMLGVSMIQGKDGDGK